MLRNEKGQQVHIANKQLTSVFYKNIRETKEITEKFHEVPGRFFELGKRVKYGKRGFAPVSPLENEV